MKEDRGENIWEEIQKPDYLKKLWNGGRGENWQRFIEITNKSYNFEFPEFVEKYVRFEEDPTWENLSQIYQMVEEQKLNVSDQERKGFVKECANWKNNPSTYDSNSAKECVGPILRAMKKMMRENQLFPGQEKDMEMRREEQEKMVNEELGKLKDKSKTKAKIPKESLRTGKTQSMDIRKLKKGKMGKMRLFKVTEDTEKYGKETEVKLKKEKKKKKKVRFSARPDKKEDTDKKDKKPKKGW